MNFMIYKTLINPSSMEFFELLIRNEDLQNHKSNRICLYIVGSGKFVYDKINENQFKDQV